MNTKAITRFVIYFSAIYGLVLLTSPVGDKLYAEYFRSLGMRVFGSLIDKGGVGFGAIKNPENPKFSTNIRLANRKDYEEAMRKRQPYRSVNITVSSWYTGYLPTMLTLALLSAIPGLGWKKKIMALIGGMIVIHLFIFVKLYIQILCEFQRSEWLQVVRFSPFRRPLMGSLYQLFVASMGLNFMVPVLIGIATLLLFKNQLIGTAR